MKFARLIVLTGALFALGAVAAFGVDAYFSRRDAVGFAEREVKKSAEVLAERVRQMIGAADRTLAAAQVAHQTWQRDPGASAASGHRILRALADASDVLDDIAWFERDGSRHVTSASAFPVPINAREREFFQVHTGEFDRGLYVGKPIRSISDGRWITPVSRRLIDSSGAFIGVVGGVLDMQYIRGVLERFHATNGAAYAIILESGAFLARAPAADRTGASALETNLFRRYLQQGAAGTYRAASISTGEERLYRYQKVAGHPLIVVASLGHAEIFAPWFERLRITGALTLLAMLGAVVATFFIRRQAVKLRIERREADQARRVAEHANRSKSEFLAHMSHELRTPMNAVLGFTEMIAKEVYGPVGSPKYREYLGHIAMSGQHLLQVVNNILDLAKVEAGKWEMEEEPTDIRDLVESTAAMVRERARSAGVSLTVDGAAPVLTARVDRRLMRQIVINVLTNAIKFTERGGKVATSWTLQPDGSLALAVTDTGVGMTAEDCRRVLEPFGRGSATLARARHDTGLGLTICRQFAEMHGGRLELKSALGSGTTVTVILPAERVTTPAANTAKAA